MGIEELNNLRMQSAKTVQTPVSDTQKQAAAEHTAIKNTTELRDEFVKTKRKNGIIEKVYDWLKNKTNFGLGSKKVEKDLELYEQGQISEEQARENIKKYRTSQLNSQQLLGDAASLTAGMAAYSFVSNTIKLQSAKNQLGGNALSAMSEALKDGKYTKGLINFFKNMTKTKRIALATGASAIAGAFVKKYVLKFNRAGSKEYKSEIPKDREHKLERKYDKKMLNRQRKNANWKNFFTGGLNGLIAPLANLAGGIAGVPLVIAANLCTRYFQSQKDKDAKASLGDFVEKFKDNAALNTAGAALIAVPLFKRGHYNSVLTKNIEKVVTKLKAAKLTPTFNSSKTAYTELKDMLLDSENLNKIINGNLPVEKKITQIIDENIFAAKFIQNAGNETELARALKESCPPSRTIDEAKQVIEKTFGKKYQPTKLLGVGTVAETYLAKNAETGEEVCVKLLKNGITADKIKADKEKMIALVKSQVKDEKQLQYYINNIEDLAEAIGKEVDLKTEMEAAKSLAQHTKAANVVKPLEIKDNIYVMEKAPGISLKTLQDVSSLEARKNYLNRMRESNNPLFKNMYSEETIKDEIQQIDKEIKQIKSKSPDFEQINISAKEIDRLLSQYLKVYTEQFDSIKKGGKVIHGDIHPGNIFIDLKALKSGNGKAFTLIDTGNTINMTMEQSHQALKLNEYIKRGNVKDISKYVMEGAILPDNMTKEAAVETMEKELRKMFFDDKSALDFMNNDSVLALTSNIMRKYNIIPGSTQLNLEKAKHSAKQSLDGVMESLIETKYSSMKVGDSTAAKAKAALKVTKDMADWGRRFVQVKKVQEAKNMTQYPLSQIISSSRNPNMLKTNSEDYLTYHFKQLMDKTNAEKFDSLS